MKSILILVAIFLTGNLLAQDEYKIKFDRNEKVGTKYGLEAKAVDSKTMKMSREGKVLKSHEENMEYNFFANITIQEHDTEKKIFTSKIAIHSFSTKNLKSGEVSEIFKKGTVIIRKRVDKTTEFTIEDKALEPAQLKAIKKIFSSGKTSVKDDDIFGTEKLKKIGDSWPINKKTAIEDLKNEGIEIGENDLSGFAKLEKKETILDTETLLISGKLSSEKMPMPPNMKLPQNAVLEASRLEVTFMGHFPTDLVTPRLTSSYKMSGFLDIVIPGNGSAIHLKTIMKSSKELKRVKFKED